MILVLALVTVELAVRVSSDRLPPPLVWSDYETQNKAESMDELPSDASVVFIGSSSMNAAADPLMADKLTDASLPAFNGALNGSDMRSAEWWVTHVVLPRLKPSVVVVGTTSLEVNDNGKTQEEFFTKLTSSKGAKRVTGHVGRAGRLEAWFEDHVYLARYRNELRRPAHVINGDPRAERAGVGPRGVLEAMPEFHDRPYSIPPNFKVRTERESYRHFAVGGSQVQALHRLVDMLKQENVKLVLVKMPITRDLIPMHPHGQKDYERFERVLDEIVDARALTLVDAASRIDDERYFVDPIHLNARGAERFTRLVAPAIREATD